MKLTISTSHQKAKSATNDNPAIKYSVDKNVLGQIDHPLADLIIRFRNKAKLRSTYVDGFRSWVKANLSILTVTCIPILIALSQERKG